MYNNQTNKRTNKQTYLRAKTLYGYTKEINSHVSEMVNQRKLYSIKLVIFSVSVNDNNLFDFSLCYPLLIYGRMEHMQQQQQKKAHDVRFGIERSHLYTIYVCVCQCVHHVFCVHKQ